MDLLGDYGDDDESDQEEKAPQPSANNGSSTAAPTQGLSTLVGYLQQEDEDDNAKPAATKGRAALSTEPSPSPTISSRGVLGSWIKEGREGTPTMKPRNAAIRIISKSTTPQANSPQVPLDVPSDASCPSSPTVTDGTHAANAGHSSMASLPDVTLPPAPEGTIPPTFAIF